VKKLVTINEAKKLVKDWLQKNNFKYPVKGRTISFSDLGYGDRIFIKVVGWEPHPKWSELEEIGKKNGFCIES
jgi:hypothetical protein